MAAATPIVWGDKIFIQTAIGTGKKVEPADQKAAPSAPDAAAAKPRFKSDIQLHSAMRNETRRRQADEPKPMLQNETTKS